LFFATATICGPWESALTFTVPAARERQAYEQIGGDASGAASGFSFLVVSSVLAAAAAIFLW